MLNSFFLDQERAAACMDRGQTTAELGQGEPIMKSLWSKATSSQ